VPANLDSPPFTVGASSSRFRMRSPGMECALLVFRISFFVRGFSRIRDIIGFDPEYCLHLSQGKARLAVHVSCRLKADYKRFLAVLLIPLLSQEQEALHSLMRSSRSMATCVFHVRVTSQASTTYHGHGRCHFSPSIGRWSDDERGNIRIRLSRLAKCLCRKACS
jgi:hypothetical protein